MPHFLPYKIIRKCLLFGGVHFLFTLKAVFCPWMISGQTFFIYSSNLVWQLCFLSEPTLRSIKLITGKPCPAQIPSVCVFISRILRCSRKILIIHLHPVDVCKRLAVHFVNEQAALQVVHLVLDDTGCPSARLPHHLLPSGVQPCKVSYSLGKDMLNRIIFNLLAFSLPLAVPVDKRQHQKGMQTAAPILPRKDASTLHITKYSMWF